jgi:predicted nucleic acid-binding protein
MRTFPGLGVIGGAVYDALIAETARAHGATILTLDRRACITYDRIGVSYQLIG